MGALKFYFFGALKEADVIRYPIEKKAFEMGKDKTERLEKLIYENNPKNIIDYRSNCPNGIFITEYIPDSKKRIMKISELKINKLSGYFGV